MMEIQKVEVKLGENQVDVKHASEAPKTLSASPVLVIGLGQMGTTALRSIALSEDPEANPFLNLWAIESNSNVVGLAFDCSDETATSKLKKWVEADGGRFSSFVMSPDGFGAGGDPEAGASMATANLEGILKFVMERKVKTVLIVAGGGGGSCGAMPVIAKALVGEGIWVCGILTTPFANEGTKRILKAKRVKDPMREICPVLIIENEKFPDPEMEIDEAWQKINETSLFWILHLWKTMLQDIGDIRDLDRQDLQRAIETGNWMGAGFCNVGKNGGLDNFERDLFENPVLLQEEVLHEALHVLVLFRGVWKIGEINKVIEAIKQRMVVAATVDYEIKPGIQRRGVPEGEKTVGYLAFAPTGPDDPKRKKTPQPEIAAELPTASAVPSIEPPSEPEKSPEPVVEENKKPSYVNGNGESDSPAQPVSRYGGPRVPATIIVNKEAVKVVLPLALAAQYNQFFVKGLSSKTLEDAAREFEMLREAIWEETDKKYIVDTPPWLTMAGIAVDVVSNVNGNI